MLRWWKEFRARRRYDREDRQFQKLMDRLWEAQGEELQAEARRLTANPDFQLPEGFSERVLSALDAALAAREGRVPSQRYETAAPVPAAAPRRPFRLRRVGKLADLFQAHRGLMFSEARKLVGNDEAAEDVVQDAVVQLLDKAALLRTLDQRALTAYMASAARNTAVDLVRRERRNGTVSWECLDFAAVELLRAEALCLRRIEELLLIDEARAEFLRVWEGLDETTRELLERKYLLGETTRELALRFRVSDAAMHMLLHRARRRALFAEPKRRVEQPSWLRLVK